MLNGSPGLLARYTRCSTRVDIYRVSSPFVVTHLALTSSDVPSHSNTSCVS